MECVPLKNREKTYGRLSLLLALIICAATVPLVHTLSLAESVTAFISGDGWVSTIKRSVEFGHTSPLYYLLMTANKAAIGNLEAGMRLPSIAFALLALGCLYRLLSRRVSTLAALVCLTLLTLNSNLVSLLVAAEPFSIGLLFFIISFDSWLTCVTEKTIARRLIHLFSTIAAIYLNYIFLVPLIILHLIVWFDAPKPQRGTWRSVLFYFSSVIVLTSPALMHTVDLYLRPELLSLPKTPGLPEQISLSFVGLILAYCLYVARGVEKNPECNRSLLFAGIGLWIVCAVMSFSSHYVLNHGQETWSIGFFGLAISLSTLIDRTAKRDKILILVSFASLFVTLTRPQEILDWKLAAATLRQDKNRHGPVILLSGLPEAENRAFYQRKDAGKYLSAPFYYYQIPQRVMPAGASNFSDSVDPSSFSGFLVAPSDEKLDFQGWQAASLVSRSANLVKIYRFGNQEISPESQASEDKQLDGDQAAPR